MVALSTWTGTAFDTRPHEIQADQQPTGGHLLRRIADPSKWWYRVVTWDRDHSVSPVVIQVALRLCDNEIYAPLVGLRSKRGNPDGTFKTELSHYGSLLEAAQYFLLNVDNTKVSTPDLSDVHDVARLVDELDENEFASIDRALQSFVRLDALADYVPLKHLGYFTVVESLLTHRPKATDTADSVGRQLRRNIPLVNNRLSEFGQQVDGVGDPKFISKLY